MRFAGTWSRYSNSAIAQLTSAATYQALPRRSLRCAYQANVMKTFEQVSSPAVTSITRITPPLPQCAPLDHAGERVVADGEVQLALVDGQGKRHAALQFRGQRAHQRTVQRVELQRLRAVAGDAQRQRLVDAAVRVGQIDIERVNGRAEGHRESGGEQRMRDHRPGASLRPTANRLRAVRTYITPPDSAGVAISSSPIA